MLTQCYIWTHISKVSHSVSFSLCRISRIRKFFSHTCAECLIHAFVTSRLGYCNNILYGLTDSPYHNLQVLQISAARLITRTRINKHITPVLLNSQLLPISQLTEFKILVSIFKVYMVLHLYHCEVLTK